MNEHVNDKNCINKIWRQIYSAKTSSFHQVVHIAQYYNMRTKQTMSLGTTNFRTYDLLNKSSKPAVLCVSKCSYTMPQEIGQCLWVEGTNRAWEASQVQPL